MAGASIMSQADLSNQQPLPQTSSSIADVAPGTDVGRAQLLKEEGNKLFTSQKFTLAIAKYREAERLNPSVAAYSFNLSAALFEAGAYLDAVAAISRAYRTSLKTPATDAFLARLSSRLARSLCQACAAGLVTDQVASSYAELLNDIRTYAKDEDDWLDWDSMTSTLASRKTAMRASKLQFVDLPRERWTADPTIEFYALGNDRFHSILEGFSDSWYWDPEPSCPADSDINLQKLPKTRKNILSFLFGGFGDGRHVFSTLADLHNQQVETLSTKVHFALVDIHPGVLARHLIILTLFSRAWSAPNHHEAEKLFSVFFYIYCGAMIPPYAHKLVLEICQELKGKLSSPLTPLFSWVELDPASRQPITSCLDYWISLKVNKQSFVQNLDIAVHDHKCDDDEYLTREAEVYKEIKALLPLESDEESAVLRAASRYIETGKGFKALVRAKKHVSETWQPNLTLFNDDVVQRYMRLGFPDGFDRDFATHNAVEVIDHLSPFHNRIKDDFSKQPISHQRPSMAYFQVFAKRVSSALLAMTVRGQVKFELVSGDIMQYLARVDADAPSVNWRHGLPSAFTRMYMSNIPDYAGGPLELALYAVPRLRACPEAAVGFNVMFNGLVWRDSIDNFIYTYTLLLPGQLPQFLGCKFRFAQHAENHILLKTLCLIPTKYPLALAELAPRQDLQQWLQRLLIRILAPPSQHVLTSTMDFIFLPSILHTFIKLTVHLYGLGYPAHWLSDALENIARNTLHSPHRPCTYAPLSATELPRRHAPAKLHLAPWMGDVELVWTTALPSLPFAVRLPRAWPTAADFATYSAAVRAVLGADGAPDWGFSRLPAVALLFVAPGVRANEGNLRTKNALFGDDGAARRFQMLLTVERLKCDPTTRAGTVRWRMHRARVDAMRTSGWSLYLWRTDTDCAVSAATPASQWFEEPPAPLID